jgi:hypothetical protein
MRVENHGQQVLQLDPHIDPLFLTLRSPIGRLKAYSSLKGQHGFYPTLGSSPKRDFADWLVLENESAGESMLVGGEPGLGVLGWKASVDSSAGKTVVRAGTILIKDKKSAAPAIFELSPGATVETPTSFFALARGDSDNAGNETFRYLKKYVFQTPLPDSPLVTYCIWLTEKNSEESLLKELSLAKRVGFDVFYHDATWYEGASLVPGMNDWTSGLGSYQEDKQKFPHGLQNLSDSVHAMGLKFGLWVDPGNVDAARVASGEIPQDWLAMIDGKTIGTLHPSLASTKQLCLGDPKVVAWIEKQLGDIIEKCIWIGSSGIRRRPSAMSAIAPTTATARPMAPMRLIRGAGRSCATCSSASLTYQDLSAILRWSLPEPIPGRRVFYRVDTPTSSSPAQCSAPMYGVRWPPPDTAMPEENTSPHAGTALQPSTIIFAST